MKSKIAIIALLLACTFSFSFFLPSDKIIEIPKGYSGWVVVLGSSKELPKDKIILDTKGVGYIDSAALKDDVAFQYYQDGKKLGAHELKFFFTVKVVPTEFNSLSPKSLEYTAHERKIYSFCVLSPEELKKGDDYWDNEKKQRPVDGKSERHINEYIRQGWVVVE